jgi:hypothetical protein
MLIKVINKTANSYNQSVIKRKVNNVNKKKVNNSRFKKKYIYIKLLKKKIVKKE